MIKQKHLRPIAFFLTVALGASLLSASATALTPAYSITGAYRTSTYHQNLQSIPRTGDKAFDTVAVAMTQIGYHEGNGTADFNGKNTAGYKNYTEYNRVLGKVDGTYGYAWCAAFVSWCLMTADAADAAGGTFVSCSLWIEALRANGQYSQRASGYSPKEGDLVFFRSAGAGRISDHVGLVRYVENGRVYTIEGNSSDKVSLNSYALSSTYIVGYGKPNYGEDLIPSTAYSAEDVAVGWYTVSHDFVNLRSGPGTSHTKLGKLYFGNMIRIFKIENGWGAFERDGTTLYLSLDYADFVSPISHRVTYDANGGAGQPENALFLSLSQRRVADALPTREQHRFAGWQASDGKIYQAGDPLPIADVSLTALWEVIPTAEAPDTPMEDAPPSSNEEITPPEHTQDSTSDTLLAPLDPPTPPLPESSFSTSTPPETQDYGAVDVATAIVLTLFTSCAIFAYVRYKKRHAS